MKSNIGGPARQRRPRDCRNGNPYWPMMQAKIVPEIIHEEERE
jgi:hypothetical protein